MTNPRFKCKAALTAVSVACLLSACGGSSSDDFKAQSQGKTTTEYSGKVIDGYVSGAKVCIDANANNACDAGEVSTTTDLQGAYSLLTTAVGNLVASGGTNTDTLKPNDLILSAPSDLDYGSSNIRQITPLTTMAATLKQAADKTERAGGPVKSSDLAALIKEGFGLTGNFDLFRFDPIARANNTALSDADRELALNVHRAGVQVANTVLTSMALDKDKSPAGQAKKFIVFFALAVQESEDPDLTSETQLRKVLLAGSDVEPSDAQVRRLAESNARVQTAATVTAIGLEQNDYLGKLATNPSGETTPPDTGGGDGDNGPGDNGSGEDGAGDAGGFNPADFLSPTVLCNIPVLGPILVNNVLALILAPIPVPGFDDLKCPEGGEGGFELPAIPGLPGLPGAGGDSAPPGLPGAGGDSPLPSLPGAEGGASLLAPLTGPLTSGICLIPVLGPQIINLLSMIPSNPLLSFTTCPEGDDGGFSFPGIG